MPTIKLLLYDVGVRCSTSLIRCVHKLDKMIIWHSVISILCEIWKPDCMHAFLKLYISSMQVKVHYSLYTRCISYI